MQSASPHGGACRTLTWLHRNERDRVLAQFGVVLVAVFDREANETQLGNDDRELHEMVPDGIETVVRNGQCLLLILICKTRGKAWCGGFAQRSAYHNERRRPSLAQMARQVSYRVGCAWATAAR